MDEPTYAADLDKLETQSLHAWSQADDAPTVIDYQPKRSWRLPLLAGVVAAAALTTGVVLWPHNDPTPAQPHQVSAPKPQVAPPPETLDQRFLRTVQQRGVQVVSPPAALKGAHDVCRLEGEGHNAKEIAEAFTQVTPGASLKVEGIFVMTAQEVYCP